MAIPQLHSDPHGPDLTVYMTKQQVATYLGVSIRTIDALMKKKKIGYLKLSRKLVRFRKADVDAHLASNYRVMAFGE